MRGRRKRLVLGRRGWICVRLRRFCFACKVVAAALVNRCYPFNLICTGFVARIVGEV